jgi:hypothetical protein
MPSTVVTLRESQLMPIEAAAQILGWIVYPANSKQRERWANAVVLLAPREAALRDPRWKSVNVRIKAGALIQSSESAERIVKRAWPTLRRRIMAGNMALPLIAEAAGFQVKLAPDGADLLSLNQVAARVAGLIGGEDGGDDRNVKTRIWAPSRPVLHLCAALAAIMQCYWDRWGQNLWGLLEDPDAICELVKTAEMYRPVIARWRKTRPTVDLAQQIEVRLVS